MTDLNNLSSEETVIELNKLRLISTGIGLLRKFVFPLRQIAEIITDDTEPITYLSLRKWVDGQVLRLRPRTKFPGYKKPQFGHYDVFTFLLAKQLLRGRAGVPIPTAGVQTFLDRWADKKFLPGVSFEEKMKGRLILVPDREDASNLKVLFYRDLDEKFIAAAGELSKAGITFVTVCLQDVLKELDERICAWANDEKFTYPSNEERRKRFLESMRSARHLVREVNSSEEALTS
jgi:hypothetical protein